MRDYCTGCDEQIEVMEFVDNVLCQNCKNGVEIKRPATKSKTFEINGKQVRYEAEKLSLATAEEIERQKWFGEYCKNKLD